MAIRNGQQFRAGLKDDRVVWLGDKKVDVLDEPKFQGSLKGMADYFDYQIAHADDCIVADPEKSGEKMSASLIVPRSKEDLDIRHRALDRFARYSYGMLGRTPDYVNVVLSGHVARRDIWEKGDIEFHDRLTRFHREVIDGDLSLTHAIAHANIDKGTGDLSGMNADLTLHVVKRTETGVVVRGGKMLATLGPFSDEFYVYPSSPIPSGAEDYALSFSVPSNTKGLTMFCRDHYGTEATVADAPFSSRFDEQDVFVVFDDVEVPYERLFIDGNLDVYNNVTRGVSPGNTLQQTAIRAMVKLEFAYDLCTLMARITNSEGRSDVAAMLGEIHTYMKLTKSAIAAAEANAHEWGTSGAFFPHADIAVLRSIMPEWMVRVNQIICALGSHNMLATPSMDLFENPEVGDMLRKYLPGANGISAEDRAQIMRTARDFAISSLGGRVELYEMFYLGSLNRARAGDHMIAQRNGFGGQVKEFLQKSGVGIK
ncbi:MULTISPECIES: 4-hydroxyphenylacetate 3-hydroxylase N-terminal domain-containing protein [unclassified Novosphingobium]|uniref:4-hydroxyphenylacetate 3-hydroxylase N-terminal domain-containing protein n=1 Tax=unclassified Novosphingobium TaxID=2644732 RepID=UPI0013589B3F|nr:MULTISPECIES: 4-hydroxyphenylacetate 3-hydroxylase N-terminal domain-containing protein [unclassified Novosphingobium]